MPTARIPALLPLLAAFALGACAHSPGSSGASAPGPVQSRIHRGDDDLLTAGLGAAGLASPLPPAFADVGNPSAAELRRRAIWSNWRGIADLAPGGGFGSVYGFVAPVPGREFYAFGRIEGARQPHRLMLQLPDSFDSKRRCLVVTASSGSRGIYGAIALAGAWGLSHGCAVAYTDKGAGTGYVDLATGSGAQLDGTRANAGEALEFALPAIAESTAIAVKHAHSADNPEADWGRHVEQAARFGLRELGSALPGEPAFTPANTLVIAVGLSNGGGAVLRAAELPGDLLDGVVAISPNVYPGTPGARPLYDYATEAALLMPCALAAPAFDAVALARPGGAPAALALARCASLRTAGQLRADTTAAQAAEARLAMHASGWTDAAIAAGALSVAFDLWRAIDVTYASAYSRTSPDAMPCGFQFAATDSNGLARAATAAERAAWWSDASGIPPGAGVGIVDPGAATVEPAPAGLQCLRALWTGAGERSSALRAGVAATRAALPRRGLPMIVIHGANDGLVPEAFSGAAYARWAQAAGRDLRYWRVRNAQHFDALLGLPPLAASYLPMLPYGYRALDAMFAHLSEGTALPGDADVATRKRAVSAQGIDPLRAEHLGEMP